MEVTQFNPDTGLLEVVLVHEEENCDDSGSADSVNGVLVSKEEPAQATCTADDGHFLVVDEEDLCDKQLVDSLGLFEPTELLKSEEIAEPPDNSPKIDDETVQENIQEQKDEMECLFSIYGDDYGIVTDTSFIIKLSAGHFVVRLQVDYPASYPSHSAPEPLILGAYWDEFNHQKVLRELRDLFSEGCTCVYDWTAYIQEYLQSMMDVYVNNLQSDTPTTFVEIMKYNRVQLEQYLNADDLFDSNEWVETLSYEQKKKLWKLTRKPFLKNMAPLLKKAKKICSVINMKRLYWFCAWLMNSIVYHDTIPSALVHNPKKNIKETLHLQEISLSSKALITVDKEDKGGKSLQKIVVIGDCEEQDEAERWIELAVLKHQLVSLMKANNKHNVLLRSEIHSRHTMAFQFYYTLIKIKDFDLKKFAACFSVPDLYTIRNELQISQQRRVARSRARMKLVMSANRGSCHAPVCKHVDGSLASLLKKSMRKVTDGHMFVPIGKRKSGKRGGQTVYHGTAARNAHSIVQQGLRVNGGKGAPANGAAYGRGIYTSPQVNIPFSYAGQQALEFEGKNYLCIFECKAFAGRTVSPGIFLVPQGNDIRLVGLHLYRTS